MSSPLVHAFFVGRAIAEILSEQAEKAVTNALSELGKFDAEQRETLRNFVQQVTERVEVNANAQGSAAPTPTSPRGGDLQAIIDDLRAEIAEVRTELQRYRNGAS
ncbi:DUF6825 family protein [Alkalinema pantanalense CENA528]|uniref:DUF6825 family protein n=1 Tax=Alkalinema pantanalense TaxID=1620705 RepID=UPI003D700543